MRTEEMTLYVVRIAEGNRTYYFASPFAAERTILNYIDNYYSNHDNMAYKCCVEYVRNADLSNLELEGLITCDEIVVLNNKEVFFNEKTVNV